MESKRYTIPVARKLWANASVAMLILFLLTVSIMAFTGPATFLMTVMFTSLLACVVMVGLYIFNSGKLTVVLDENEIKLSNGQRMRWDRMVYYRIDRYTNTRSDTRRMVIKSADQKIRIVARSSDDFQMLLEHFRAIIAVKNPEAVDFHNSRYKWVEFALFLSLLISVCSVFGVKFLLDANIGVAVIMFVILLVGAFVLYGEYGRKTVE